MGDNTQLHGVGLPFLIEVTKIGQRFCRSNFARTLSGLFR